MKKLFWIVLLWSAGLSAEIPIEVARERVVLRTDFGDIVLMLFPKEAPRTVAQFASLVRLGVYDTTHVFRIHPGFVAQISDVNGRTLPLDEKQKRALVKIPAEFSPRLKHEKGSLSLAHFDGEPDSGEMSFSILLGAAPHLDGKYAIFGRVESGYDVLDKMLQVPREGTSPKDRISIRKAALADTEADLARILGETPVTPFRTIAGVTATNAHGTMVFALCAIAFIGFVTALFRQKMNARMAIALHLVNLLIALFSLLIALGPQTRESPWIGAFLVFSLLLTFRLFSRFETA